jgi:hypothetical protein
MARLGYIFKRCLLIVANRKFLAERVHLVNKSTEGHRNEVGPDLPGGWMLGGIKFFSPPAGKVLS